MISEQNQTLYRKDQSGLVSAVDDSGYKRILLQRTEQKQRGDIIRRLDNLERELQSMNEKVIRLMNK